MNEERKVSGLYSWPVIVAFLIFFWPVGIYLLIRRTSDDWPAQKRIKSGWKAYRTMTCQA